MNNPLTNNEKLLKQLKFRSWHRGWKETDLILGNFADANLEKLSETELLTYGKLLDEDDDVIWAWIIGKEAPPEEYINIIKLLEGYGRQPN